MTIDDLVELIKDVGNKVRDGYRIFFLCYGSIWGICTLARLYYALKGIDYDPLEAMWKYLIKSRQKKLNKTKELKYGSSI
jgi:hypothetical protein